MLVGVVGGGQLGRMLALAGLELGYRFRFLDPSPEAPAADVGELVVAAYDDAAGLERLVEGADAITYEFENVPVDAVLALTGAAPVFPPPRALEVSQDRLAEKTLFGVVGIPFHAYRPVDGLDELSAALHEVKVPAVLKTRRLGYDGKGQVVIRSDEEAAAAWEAAGSQPCILEAMVEFDREVSILAVRGREGEVAFYPLVQTHHRDGILRRSVAPAPDTPVELQSLAEGHARRVLEELDYVGVLAIELFQVGDTLLANEMAPRVHNSGHWTIEGAETSQFENHVRAVTGMPLGSTAPRGSSVMLNVIGEEPNAAAVLAVPGAHLHRYRKEERAGRKIGHVTVRADEAEVADARAEELLPLLDPEVADG